MTVMESKQPVSTTCSVTSARETQSTTPPLGEGRNVAFPPPEPERVQVATTPVPEPELTVRDRPTSGHLEETVLYSLAIITRYSPSRPAYRSRVVTNKTTVSTTVYTEQVPHSYTRSPSFYT